MITQQREKVVPRARGQVLEIGIGSGLNLPFYDHKKVRHVWGLDPNEDMWNLTSKPGVGFGVEYLQAPAEKIPLEDGSADSIVVTYALCSVPQTIEALIDMRRVLRPGGELIFCEHGAAPEPRVRRWQERLNPIWQKAAGGCRLVQRAEGYEATYVSGVKVFENGQHTGALPGKLVRAGRDAETMAVAAE